MAQQLIGTRDVRNNSLTGADVRNRSLTGADVRSNSLTGRVVGGLSGRDVNSDSLDGTDIDEGSLAEVPRAAAAGTADALAGGTRVARISYTRPAGNDATTIFEGGGLTLRARCSGQGDTAVLATTSELAWIRVTSNVRAGNSVAPTLTEDDEFAPNEEFNVLAGGADNAAGTLMYLGPGGGVVTVDFISETGVGAPRQYACLFAGTALQAPA